MSGQSHTHGVPTPRVRLATGADEVAARFARDLVAARAVAGLTQSQVARRARVSQAMVSQAERCRTLPSLSVMHRLAAATGHDLSLRFFPADGIRLRDSGQLRVAERIRVEADGRWHVRLEVPIGPPPDRRAADMVLQAAGACILVEVERALLDFQAQLRAAQLKRAAMTDAMGRTVRLVIAMPDTRRNRAVVDAHRAILETALPVPSRKVWACLRAGAPIGGDGLLWVRSRAPANPGKKRGY